MHITKQTRPWHVYVTISMLVAAVLTIIVFNMIFGQRFIVFLSVPICSLLILLIARYSAAVARFTAISIIVISVLGYWMMANVRESIPNYGLGFVIIFMLVVLVVIPRSGK